MERLLGNEQLLSSLRSAFRQNRISHSYLICGPRGSGKHTLARLIAAAMQCTGKEAPCGVCEACRKVFSGVHPDVVTVDDTAHVGVGVDVIRAARSDLFVRPNEGKRKIYLFPRAMDMNANAQNALLKVLEEPPDYGAFLLLTDAEEKLLPTIRSRCAVLHLSPLSEAVCLPALRKEFPERSETELLAAYRRGEGYYGQAAELLREQRTLAPQTQEFLRVFAQKDRLGLTKLLIPMEKIKQREQLSALLTEWLEQLSFALRARYDGVSVSSAADAVRERRTAQEILGAMQHLQRAIELCRGNVGIGALCGALQLWLL